MIARWLHPLLATSLRSDVSFGVWEECRNNKQQNHPGFTVIDCSYVHEYDMHEFKWRN